MSEWKVTGADFDATSRAVFTVTKGSKRLDHREQEELEALLDGWISVDERLPQAPGENCVFETVDYLVTDGEAVGKCDYQWGNGCGKPWAAWGIYGDISFERITHWMPIPKPPAK